MSGRCIFHVDVNSAFLSWSAVKKLKDEPGCVDLRTIPSAVAGDVETRHGIITAKSIPAKKYGISTAEPVVKALQKCPELVLVKSDFKTYREYSRLFIEILQKYSDYVQQVSIDEAFMDMSGTVYAKDPVAAAVRIKNEIYATLGFTVNVGISVNKLLAKMASDFEKPDKVHTLYPEEIEKKMWGLPIGDLFGCGRRTAVKLKNIGINTIGEAAKTDINVLISLLGEKSGEYIHDSANGLDDSEVSVEEREAKSYSNESTTLVDIDEANFQTEGLKIVHELAASVSRRMKRDNVYAGTIEASVKTTEFKRRSHQRKLMDSTNDEKVIEENAKALFKEMLYGEKGLFRQGKKLRLIGVGASNLDRQEYKQMSFLDMLSGNQLVMSEEIKKPYEKAEKDNKLKQMIEKIDAKFGKGVIKKGI
ncbi:MAG: DNA polymerase IV [Lachnospiraceae bacterium]|nr:DNA polymerase IV [Lachnospiraceae bacterium]